MGLPALDGLFGSFSHYIYGSMMSDKQDGNSWIGKFKNQVHNGGFAHNHLFLTQIPYTNKKVKSDFTSKQYEALTLLCQSATIPSLNIMTATYREGEAHYEVPYGISNEPVTMHFYCDAKLEMKALFDKWYASIVNTRSMENLYSGSNRLSFMDDYTSDVVILMIDKQHSTVYEITLRRAWPKSIGGFNLEQANTQVASFPVTFSYERLEIRPYAAESLLGAGKVQPLSTSHFPIGVVETASAVGGEFIQAATGYSTSSVMNSINQAVTTTNDTITDVRDKIPVDWANNEYSAAV